MNILVLNYEFPPLGGGAAPVSRDISLQLCKRGHSVTVVTMGYKDLPGYEELQGVKIYRLKCLRRKKSSCMPWEQYTYLVAVRHFMKKHMKAHHYDICHTHFIIPSGEAAEWVRKKYGIPYVITAHGSDVEGYNQKKYMKVMHRFLRPAWRKIVRQSEGVVAPSAYLQSLMEKEYSQGKYIYIPNGLNIAQYHNLTASGQKEKKILLMGRMQKYKNMQTALKAIAKIDIPGWTIDVLGDGPYREELEKLVTELGIADRVSFHGWIDNGTEEQLQFIGKAAIYISASQFENCPMAVIETAAAGCYPFLSDIPAHRQLIAEDQYYFGTNNDSELAVKIKERVTKIENGLYENADVMKYDWENIIPQYEAVFQNAIAVEKNRQ